ncbi:MAG TPA: TaqI-like C-terminal specificity domain-containing protein [Flavobacteriales bacterium]|nr:TaqI-like C-terminal specificity domain-containing protein [Flavobacteriales bacterium]
MSDIKDLKLRIKEALEAFATGDLSDSALRLLKTLGYSAPRLNYFTKGSFAEFEDNFGGNSERFSTKNALAEQWKRVDVLFQLTGDNLGAQAGLFRNEKVDNTIIESYLFFVLELKPKKDNAAYTRTELSQITREVNKCFAMPAMILFKTGDTLSFAVIDRRLHKRESSKDVLEKVTLIKDIRTTAPHRAHIEILFDLCLEQLRKKHDVPNFPKLHEAWRKTLDTKELNKRFFRELSNWYFHAVEVTQWPADAEPDTDKRNAINTIRLITRLMFVWFLKEKDLVPEDLFDTRKLDRMLRTDSGEESLYYKAILQNLFFATLNTEMGEKRRFRIEADRSQSKHYFIHNVFRYERCFKDPKAALKDVFAPIPFLNGGLFECLDKQVEVKGKLVPVRVDGFSDRKDNPLLVPDKLFFDPEGEEYDFSEVYGSKKARKEKVRGLIDILSSYKFTITENTPIEEEVALDPELLGKVFENLLANYNPETKTTARKQTGSFYTPREIVNYMVDESLIAYLKTSLGDVADVEARLRHLLSYTEEAHQFTKAETEKLIAAIDTCKILDPACGSGAFPMGVLHKLVHVLHKLDPQNKQWKERQVEKAALLDDADIRERTIADIEDAFANNALDYGRKLYLIENGIYGVDIQPIAMQIAKLRFFISLVVDQRVDAKRPNLGVRPLPNLETKFVAANTLMKLEREEANLFTNPAIDKKKAQLKRVRHDYFEARTPQRKAKCREQDKQLREELAELLVGEHELQPKTAKMLAAWDPYDQNASAPFFDPEWMFGLSEGFSMVIGNPPYVRQETFTALKADLQRRYPETFTSIADLFTYFMQVGHDMLAPNGVFCYIVSNKWMRAGYGAKLRAYLGKQKLLQLLDFGEQPVFEATAYTCVLLSQKAAPQKDHAVLTWSFTDLPLDDLPGFVRGHAHAQRQSALVQADYRIGDAAAEALMAKLKSTGTTLGAYLKGRIYRGVLTGYNKAFVIDKNTRDALIKADKRSKEVIKPFLVGKDLKRYGTPTPEQWLILFPYGVTKELIGKEVTNEGLALRGMRKLYPPIMNHLELFIEECRARTDQGQFWWELRACSYYDEFNNPKAYWPSISGESSCFAWDGGGMYGNDNTHMIVTDSRWILGLLNSPVIAEYLARTCDRVQGGFIRMKKGYVEGVPIVEPTAKVKAQLEKLVEKRLGLEAGPAAEKVEREIDQVVYGLYGLTEEEIGIVEGSGKRKDQNPDRHRGSGSEDQTMEKGAENGEPVIRKRGRPRKSLS